MLIEARDLAKAYPAGGWLARFGAGAPPTRALDGISLKLSPGTITGLTGPNGAGKSTLLRILAGLLVPDAGTVALDGRTACGRSLRAAAALSQTGARSFYLRLTASENLDFFGALYGHDRADTRERTGALLKVLGVREEDLKKRFDALSEGAAQKFSLARALLRGTPTLLLDEPARNLDLRSAAAFSAYIKKSAAEKGISVLYTSHSPAELAQVCDRVLVLKEGHLSGEVSGGELKKAAAAGPPAVEAAIAGITV
ncbi:MAG: ABC transporter ATP-binding protein [Elusimicrobiales bacterium]|jgi:ABC-type multidrug transport system ATPase subunit